ncbi:MAG: response regulator [Proteobacteria bacterium]|nr:response regulator [Pseudomonadota bacterium]
MDENKSREELISDLEELRKRVSILSIKSANRELKDKVIEHTSDMIFIINEDGVTRDYHSNNQELYTSGTIRGVNLKDTIPPEISDMAIPIIKKVIETDQSRSFSYQMDMPDGLRYYKATINKCGVDEVICFIRDVTIHKLAKIDLLRPQNQSSPVINNSSDVTKTKKSEQKNLFYKQLFEQSLNEIYIFDSTTLNFIQVNQGALVNLGYARIEMLDMTVLDIKKGLTLGQFEKEVEPLRRGKKNKITIYTTQSRKDGSEYDVEIHLQLFPFESGEVFVAIVLDITEQKLLQSQLRQSQKMEAIGSLTGGIAHEFNNLLAPILGFTEMLQLQKSANDPDLIKLKNVQTAGNRAKVLVQQMLAYGRQSQSQKETVHLKSLVDEPIKLIRGSFPPNIVINEEWETDLPPIRAMSNEIGQVVLNLCVNASFAMPEGGILTIGTKNVGYKKFISTENKEIEGEFVGLSVKDNGVGIDKKIQDKIFDPFFSTKEVGSGSGLGLSVVQGIVEQHNGHIEVESLLGQGSTFRIYFPVAEKEIKPLIEERNKDLQVLDSKIMLIDDEPMIIDLTKSMLEILDYKVTSFTDSKDALMAFGKHPEEFDLILTDYGMPKLNGKQLIEEMRKTQPEIPSILLTGYGDLIGKENIGDWGINDLLVKPFELEELSKVVQKVLEKNQTH